MTDLDPIMRNRIANEAKWIQKAGVPLTPVHPRFWRGELEGQGKWKRQKFLIEIELEDGYPSRPPVVRFRTQPEPRHPNVSPSGYVCLNLLIGSWSPVFNLVTVWDLLGWLLANPSYKSGFVPEGFVEGQLQAHRPRRWRLFG